jgi:hypothetical protein
LSMRTFLFQPGLGQRYLRRQPGVPDAMFVLSGFSRPKSIEDEPLVTLSEELGSTSLSRTPQQLASDILAGVLYPQDRGFATDATRPFALSELIVGMSRTALRDYKTRVAYVLHIARGQFGKSHKSKAFQEAISNLYEQRMARWLMKAASSPDDPPPPMESHAPAPTSVYRWFLNYRTAGNDLRILARAEETNRTRSARKPKEKELALAFLTSRMAEIGTTPITTLTDEFNRFVIDKDPSRVDELIEQLRQDADRKAKLNKYAARNRGTRRKGPKQPAAPVIYPSHEALSRVSTQ